VYRVINDTVEAIWQLPPSGRPPRALVFVSHPHVACARRFWPPSRACPVCNGFNNMMCIVAHLVAHDLAVFVVSAPSRTFLHRPFHPNTGWEWPKDKEAMERALAFAKEAVQGPGGRLPLLLLSLSSGALPAFDLPGLGYRFAAHASVMPHMAVVGHGAHGHPPTLIYHQPRDRWRSGMAVKAIKELRRAGIPALRIEAVPMRLGPTFFSHALPHKVTPMLSERLHAALRRHGFLDANDFVVNYVELPENDAQLRQSEAWKDAVRDLTVEAVNDSLPFHQSDFHGVISVAYGFHAVPCSPLKEALADFFVRAVADKPVWPADWTSKARQAKHPLFGGRFTEASFIAMAHCAPGATTTNAAGR